MRRTRAHRGVDRDDVGPRDAIRFTVPRQIVVAAGRRTRIRTKEVERKPLRLLDHERGAGRNPSDLDGGHVRSGVPATSDVAVDRPPSTVHVQQVTTGEGKRGWLSPPRRRTTKPSSVRFSKFTT